MFNIIALMTMLQPPCCPTGQASCGLLGGPCKDCTTVIFILSPSMASKISHLFCFNDLDVNRKSVASQMYQKYSIISCFIALVLINVGFLSASFTRICKMTVHRHHNSRRNSPGSLLHYPLLTVLKEVMGHTLTV